VVDWKQRESSRDRRGKRGKREEAAYIFLEGFGRVVFLEDRDYYGYCVWEFVLAEICKVG
jgi:hypothetical protein